jgi:hypothetical protein
MAIDEGFFFMILLFIGGAVSFGFGFHFFRIKRLIENLPTSKIRSLAIGLVEIAGEVVPREKKLLRSPISGKDCVYYTYRVEELRSSGKSSHWQTLKSGIESYPFYLKDETGKVVVEPKEAGIEIDPGLKAESGIGKDFPQIVKDFLKKSNISYGGFLGIHNAMRVSESFIQPGEKLYIIGSATDNPDPSLNPKKSEDNLVVRKGKNDRLFYISDKGELEVRRRFGWKTAGFIALGSILMLVSLIVILIYLGLF